MAPSPKQNAIPEAALAAYERLVALLPDVELKSNFGSAYTALNGNMFTMISKHGVVGIRLPKADREAFLAEHDTELFRGDPAWPPAKEYVAVPATLLANTEALRPSIEASYRYVQTLKPKAARKRSTSP